MNTTPRIITVTLVATLSSQAATVINEQFEGQADGIQISTSNTTLTYVRPGSQGVLEFSSPGSFGTGGSAVISQISSTGSLAGLGIESQLPSSDVYTLTLDFRPLNLNGDFVIGIGSGTVFTGNGTFNTAQGLFWLQSDNGNFERRTSSWNDIGTSGTSLAINTNYSLRVVANGSASSLTYGSAATVAPGTMDIYLNNVLLDDDVPVTNSLAADGFRIYNVNQGDVEIDNITICNAAIPEPSTTLLGGLALLGLLRRRR